MEKIEKYAESLFESRPVYIEYLSNNKTNGFDVDYFFTLDSEHIDTIEVNQFIQYHKSYYDLIILNTCPCGLMDYYIIHTIIKPDGYLSITTFTNKHESANDPTIMQESYMNSCLSTSSSLSPIRNIHNYFNRIPDTNLFGPIKMSIQPGRKGGKTNKRRIPRRVQRKYTRSLKNKRVIRR